MKNVNIFMTRQTLLLVSDTLGEIQALKASTLPSVVHRHLHRLIITGAIRPGQKINEVALANEMAVSRGPIREACRQLLSSGLLEAHPQRGFFVRTYSLEEANELTVVRAHLAELVGRLATPRITEADIKELRSIVDAMRTAYALSQIGEFYDNSFLFYERICEAVGNRPLKEYYFDVSCRTRLFRIRAHPRGDTITPEIAEAFDAGIQRRLLVIQALEDHNAEAVGTIMRENVETSFVRNERLFLRRRDELALIGKAS
jgi:DNA-binding GntR family transcriptional regulator